MNKQSLIFLLLNLTGGSAVLGSYAHGLLKNTELRSELWGAVPDHIRPYYTICMFLAAIGYFFFTGYILQYVSFDTTQIFGCYNFTIINLLYAGFLIPSALWIYMTFAMIINPSVLLWIGIRIILFTIGFSSIGLFLAFFFSNFEKSSWLFYAGIAGLIPFSIQTMILDAIVWPYYFPMK